jgi:hypothetical protein
LSQLEKVGGHRYPSGSLIAILIPIYPKQNNLLGSLSRKMQARKYQKIVAILPKKEQHTMDPRTLQETQDILQSFTFIMHKMWLQKVCNKITKKKMGENERERGEILV